MHNIKLEVQNYIQQILLTSAQIFMLESETTRLPSEYINI